MELLVVISPEELSVPSASSNPIDNSFLAYFHIKLNKKL